MSLEVLRSLGYIDSVSIRQGSDSSNSKLTHVVAAGNGGSVNVLLNSKDGIPATAG